MIKRIRCMFHEEKTPSLVVYKDHAFCFGACGKRYSLEEIGEKPTHDQKPASTYVENIQASIHRIQSLPQKEIRGFSLHFDFSGYYLVFPCKSYYKFRSFSDKEDHVGKYRGPSGHSKPAFQAQVTNHLDRLILVEGEFNAMSLALLKPDADVISPGGAGDFYSRSKQKDLQKYAMYARVDIVVDEDAAGVQAAIECTAQLIANGCLSVKSHLVKKDFNDIYVQDGLEELKRTAERMGLLGRVPSNEGAVPALRKTPSSNERQEGKAHG